MSKKGFLIFSLILTIITIVYLFLDYFGHIRFWKLCNKGVESFMDKYKSTPKTKDRTVVSFSGENSKNIKPFINSILDQSKRVHDIVLTTKYGKNYPSYLDSIVTYHKYSKDYDKDISTIICSLLREGDANTKIVILSPDMVYGEDFIEKLVKESDDSPESIIMTRDKKAMLIKPAYFNENCLTSVSIDQLLKDKKIKIIEYNDNKKY